MISLKKGARTTMEFNFVRNILETDKSLFFGPLLPEDTFTFIEPHWTLAHIMHHAKIFKSVSDARKNGWNKPIPSGWSEYRVGKLKHYVCILNITEA